jgi:hypothetical protein
LPIPEYSDFRGKLFKRMEVAESQSRHRRVDVAMICSEIADRKKSKEYRT